MIGSLRGVLTERWLLAGEAAAEVVVEVGGVGYRVVVPAPVASAIGYPGDDVYLHVHTYVKEDALVLYGFAEREQLRCFEALIAAHGVGPSLAMSILAVHSPASLHAAVDQGDVDALVLVPGVGPKTAARLLIELEARLDGAAARGPERVTARADSQALAEVREALGSLGYAPEEVRRAMSELPQEGATDDLLRAALHELAGVR